MIQLGVQHVRINMLYSVCPAKLSLPLPNCMDGTRWSELAQSDSGPFVHKILSDVVQGVSISSKPSWTALSIPSAVSCSFSVSQNNCYHCTGKILFYCRSQLVCVSSPAGCITLSSLYPYHLYSAACSRCSLKMGVYCSIEWMNNQIHSWRSPPEGCKAPVTPGAAPWQTRMPKSIPKVTPQPDTFLNQDTNSDVTCQGLKYCNVCDPKWANNIPRTKICSWVAVRKISRYCSGFQSCKA